MINRILRFLSILLISNQLLFISTGDKPIVDISKINKASIGIAEISKIEIEQPKEEKEEVVTTPIQTVVKEETTVPVSAPSYSNSIRISNVLNKPLMKDTTGDNFYLNHNLNGVQDNIGVPYIDFRNNFYTRKTIIYAHSTTNNNGPFQVLQNYHNNKSFYDNNKYITITYNGNTYTYLIFSVYVSLAENIDSEGLDYFYDMDYTDSEWQETINGYKNKSEYDTGVSVNASDRIVILQTCSMDPNYMGKYYRYNLLVMGKLI